MCKIANECESDVPDAVAWSGRCALGIDNRIKLSLLPLHFSPWVVGEKESSGQMVVMVVVVVG